jgi:hypothetical protein
MTGHSKLTQGKATVIAGNLLMAIDGQPLFFQSLTDQIKQDVVLPNPAGQGHLLEVGCSLGLKAERDGELGNGVMKSCSNQTCWLLPANILYYGPK